ncbi:MAG: PspA-associated protein PspAB [Solirubrobacteraceae bacterium]
MGLLSILTGRKQLAKPAPDRLFAMSTAYVTLETGMQITTRGSAAIVFQALATADFQSIVTDMEEVVRATASDSATTVHTREDEFGFSWLILKQDDPGDARSGEAGSAEAGSAEAGSAATGSAEAGSRAGSFDDLVVGINAVSTALEAGGYGERILCAVFAFRDARGRALYWIYNYKRGMFYPFVAAGGPQQRDNERELVLRAQIGRELPVEPELQRWFPLWGIPI